MPLIKAQLEAQIKAKLIADAQFKKNIFTVTKRSMDRFQTAQKQALVNAGTSFAFSAAKQVASIAFAQSMQELQQSIAFAVAPAVADAVDSYIKLGQVIIPAPLGPSTPAAPGSPVLIPAVPPGKII